MSQERTIIYIPSIEEVVAQYNLPINNPSVEDWGLVTEGPERVRIHFIYSRETITIAQTTYNRIVHEYPHSEVFSPENPTEEVLHMGSDAILDIKHGEPPLNGIGDNLPSAVATVFAMQSEQGWREWPEQPQEEIQNGVPVITVSEPVYSDLDADTSRWVSCQVEWDPEREVFVNSQADPDWELDEEAAADASYIVNGEDRGNIQEAMLTALNGTDWEDVTPTVIIESDENESPEWGLAA